MLPMIFLNKKDICNYELNGEILKDRICDINIDKILNQAYERGRTEAVELKKKKKKKGLKIEEHISLILKEEGLSVEEKDQGSFQNDYILYSECYPKLGKIILYKDSIKDKFLPGIPTNYSNFRDFNVAKYLFILHEIYHILEYNKLGLTWDLMKVKCKLGPFKINKRLRCLNEIAAHGFVREYFNIE